MTLTEYVRRVVQRWRVIVATIVVLVAAAAAITFTITPTYQSTARVFVSNSSQIKDLGNAMAAGVYAQQKVLSYASVASSEKMGEAVVRDLGLNEDPEAVSDKISTAVEYGTVLVTLTVTDESAEQAARIAQSVIDNYNTVINSVDVTDGQAAPVTVSTMEAPTVPSSPSSPKLGLNLIAALFAGLMLGIALAALRDLLDDTIKSQQDLQLAELPSLGSVPTRGKKRKGGVDPGAIISFGEHTPTAEAFRQLRVNLQFASLDRQPRTLLVTSSGPGEGKSFVSANLAAVYSSTGLRVALVDLDLRRPVLAERLGLEKSVGVTSVLLGRATIADAVQLVTGTNIHVLASGPLPPNPSDVLATNALRDVIGKLAAEYDVVILDTPPAGLFVDARQLAALVDGAVVVARNKQTKKAALSETYKGLDDVGGTMLGVVLNRADAQAKNEYDQYGYSTYTAQANRSNKHAKS